MINHQVSHEERLGIPDTPDLKQGKSQHLGILKTPEVSPDALEATITTQHLQYVDPIKKMDHLVEDGHPNSRSAKTAIDTSTEETAFQMPTYGNGCIFKSKNRSGKVVWKVNISLGFDDKGRRKRTQRTAHSYSAALQLQREMLALALKGDLVQKNGETLQEYSIWWLKTVKSHRVKASTLTDYEDRLRRNVFGSLGRKRLQDISVRDIESWLYQLRKSGLATRSINGARQVLGAVLKHATRQGLIPKNPVELTDRATFQSFELNRAHNPWSHEEAKEAIKSSIGSDFDLFIHLALYLGLRRGEILGLKWEDFNFAEATIDIRRTLKEQRILNSDGGGTTQLVLDTPKTKASSRLLKVPKAVQESVKRHILQNEKDAILNLTHLVGHVFRSQNGGPIHPSNFARRLQEFLRGQGLRRIRIHDFRHTAASLGLEAGIRIEAVSQALGHSRIDVTKSIYAPYVQLLSNEFTYGLSEYLQLDSSNPSGMETERFVLL